MSATPRLSAMKTLAVTILAFLAGVGAAWHVRDQMDARFQRAAIQYAAKVAVRQLAANKAIDTRVVAAQARVVTVTRIITEQVPVYVTPLADHRCIVPVGFVRIHDAAAGGVPPLPFGAGQSADAASGIGLSTVAETLTSNYAIANTCAVQLKGWQDWYVAQSAAWPGQ